MIVVLFFVLATSSKNAGTKIEIAARYPVSPVSKKKQAIHAKVSSWAQPTGHPRRSILQQMDAAVADLGQLAGVNSGSLSLGTFPTLGSSFMPLIISRFRK